MDSLRTYYHRLLNSARWRALREQAMRAHSGLCADCLAQGISTPAVCVHHIVPVLTGHSRGALERLAFDPANVAALCASCHRRRHLELGSHDAGAARARASARLALICDELFGGEAGKTDPGG